MNDDDLFLESIPLIFLFILFMHTINMNGFTNDAVLYAGVLIWGLFFVAILRYIIYPDCIDRLNRMKNHCKNQVGKVLKKLTKIKIVYNERFNVSLQELDKLRDKKIFDMTLQHLKAYPIIWKKWNDLEKAEKQLKIKWNKLEKYIFNKIGRDLDDDYKDCLSFPLWVVLKESVLCNVTTLNIEMKENRDGTNLNVNLADRPSATIGLKDHHSMNKIKKFLKDLQKDNDLISIIKDVQETQKNWNTVYNQFKSELDELLEDVGNGLRLKGKCDDCPSFWKVRR